MAYSTSNPPRLMVASLGGTPFQQWVYSSTDAAAVVDGANYITNGADLGMRVGDMVIVRNTTGNITTMHQVSAVTASGADLNDLTALTQTDTD